MNKGSPPPPAVIGPPPRPNRNSYIPLLPNQQRVRCDTMYLQNELRLTQPSFGTPREQGLAPAARMPPRRTQSDRNLKQQTTTFHHSESASSKYSDFSQWKCSCPSLIQQGIEFIAQHGLEK